MSIDRWINKQNVVYTYNGKLFYFKKKGNSDTRYSMDELWKHYVKWYVSHKKTNTVWLYLYEVLRVFKFIETESSVSGVCQKMGGGRMAKLLFNGYRVSLLQDEKSSGDWLYNIVNVLNTVELCTGVPQR